MVFRHDKTNHLFQEPLVSGVGGLGEKTMTLLPEYHPWGALLAGKGKVSRQSLLSPHQAAIYTLQIRPHTPAGFCSELSLGFSMLEHFGDRRLLLVKWRRLPAQAK